MRQKIRCQCPFDSKDHGPNQCEKSAYWVAILKRSLSERLQEGHKFLLCPDCVTDDFTTYPIDTQIQIQDKLLSTLTQLHDGTITYSEFINWILVNLPAPCDNHFGDSVFGPLYLGARLTYMLERERGHEVE